MGCNSNSAQNTERLSESLIVLPKAEKVQRKEIDGTIQIFYNLKEKYPASKSINFIDAQLKSMGWISLKYDELNFGAPTALATGWNKTKDQKKAQKRMYGIPFGRMNRRLHKVPFSIFCTRA